VCNNHDAYHAVVNVYLTLNKVVKMDVYKQANGMLMWEQYKLKRCSNKECRYVMFKGTMTKWPVQKLTQGTTQKLLQHHDATDI